ncbi:MAG: gliding motility lipoprotein GldD [Bacteroidota bacterium]
MKNKQRFFKYTFLNGFLILLAFTMLKCKQEYTPKPFGFFRLDFPAKEYIQYDTSKCPFSFEYPVYGEIEKYKNNLKNPCWFNINFENYNAKIYLTYYPITRNTLSKHVEDIRSLVYKHTVKAEAIKESFYSDTLHDVYGILYDLEGNTATSVSFFLTDSTNHFLSGSLYFNTLPNKDSLAPAINFFREDISHLISSLDWK